ncbi:KR domain-containing protein [Colletotrichum abscissum]|uniref:KR domain-containing protein n=1 Tax=Colletotrichum abscissum TaxID=1671311 RepID=A0A9P9X575_9PEZI|nr:KR domain-containing protein [Colletotrichum abscissum]KAI3536794.1 KR domain-containing protein [Colletotrichum abscissum]KAK1505234.1 KR domain-containing protein [Colletotrichum abscissum]
MQDQIQPIAIVGLNLKFPGDATSAESFWHMLENARNASSKVPSTRFNVDAFYHPDPNRLDSMRVQNAHFMKEDPRAFDAAFFNMSPAEASILDPQQRGLLEGTYHTFENAGLAMERVAGSRTSVFCASFGRDSDAIVARDPEFQSRYQATSSGSSMLSNRISHFFDLRGPSLTVDTACSSGLYALHLACQSILNGESDMSLVCGSNTYLTPECMSFPLSNAGFLSPDGRSYSFDHKANGYARGEGYAFVLLKPLSKALADGDIIRSVIRATGANQDGRTPSITQPSAAAQVELIRRTYASGGLDLSETEYVEAHGTGTPVGDPIEVSAIGEVFRPHRSSPLWIGSVKSNIGHLEGASGLAGLLKTVFSLERAIIPPIADFEKVNPAIDVNALGVQFPTRSTAWPATPSGIRRASVSSFGYGGSNAHVVLDDAYNYLRIRGLTGNHLSVAKSNDSYKPCVANSSTSVGPVEDQAPDAGISDSVSDVSDDSGVIIGSEDDAEHSSISLLTFSAADEDGPRRQALALQEHVATQQISRKRAQRVFLADLAYTLSQRSILNWRAFAVVKSEANIGNNLTEILSPVTSVLSSKRPELNFVFTGQGAQYPRMGLKLMRYEVFRQSLMDCDEYLRSLGCEWSVLTELRKAPGSSRIQKPEISQPLCTALQIATVDLLRNWDIIPQSVCGHSSGEIAAAYCAGALGRQSSWKIAYFRGVLAGRLASDASRSKTTMMSVGLGEAAVRPYLSNRLSIACINSPANVTISGPTKEIQLLFERLEKEEIFVKRLPVDVGYHSPAMEVVAAEYQDRIRDIGAPTGSAAERLRKESLVSFYSSTEGNLTSFEAVTNPSYWVKNLVSPVLFSGALEAMTGSKHGGQHFLVEIGPQSALRRPVQDTLTSHLGNKAAKKWQYVSVLKPNVDDDRSLMEALGSLWAAGIPISLSKPNQESTQISRKPKILVDLPSYPFSRSREFWEESRLSRNYAKRPCRRHALLGIRDRDWNPEEGSWRHLIRSQENPWILDHALNGSPLYPGSGMLVMAIEAARQLATPVENRIRGYQLDNVRFLRAIDVDDSERGTEAKIVMRRRRQATNTSGQQLCYDWRVFGTNGDDWNECAYGSIKVELQPEQALGSEQAAASEARRSRFETSIKEQLQADVDKCRLVVHPSQLYKNMSQRSGFDYGPYFQLLTNISYDREGHATAMLSARDYTSSMPYAGEDPCVVHPSTLDAVCHLQMVALSQGGWNAVPTMMFSHLRKLWVSQKLFVAPGNPQLRVATRETMRAFREAECRTLVTFADSNEPVLVLDGQRGTAITSLKSADTAATSQGDSGQKFYSLDYKPDLSLLTVDAKSRYFAAAFKEDTRCRAPPRELIDRADAIALHFIEAALEQIDKDDKPLQFDNHLARYVKWMRRVHLNRDTWTLESRGLIHLRIEEILNEAEGEPTQRLTKKVGENLHSILKGEVNALQVIFEGNLANEFYHSDIFATNNSKMGAYINVLAHANPKLRLLEVGAGTGSSTGRILPYLAAQGVEGGPPEAVRFGEYCYTDISAGFFEKARERFSYAASHMTFKKLDLEKHPNVQGFAEGTYDVVVAGNVLHATSDLIQTLRYVRGLLRPGGVLVLGETVNLDNVRDGLIFGLLPGWWLREGQWWSTNKEYQDQGPLLTEEQWTTVLKEAGFPGIQMAFRDHEQKPHHRVSIIITTRPENESLLSQPSRVESPYRIIMDPISAIQTSVAESLRSHLVSGSQPGGADISSIVDISSGDTKLNGDDAVISLLELDASVLSSVAAKEFEAIKKISLDTRFTLWVTYGGAPKATNPAAEVAIGFGRSVCSERGDQGFVTLNLSYRPETPTAVTSAVDSIVRVVERLHNVSCPGTDNESEFSVDNGLICIPRLMPTPHMDQALSIKQSGDRLKSFTFNRDGPKPHISITIETPGLLDTIFYAENAEADKELQAGDIEIEVKATSMNFKDVMIALGQIPGRSFGFDGAGVVSRVSQESNLCPGDSVLFCSSTGGGFGTFVRCPELQTEKLPTGMSFQVAAAIPAVWSTVVYSLDHIARLSRGETVLIHAAAGGVGQAAVQLAQLRGAKVFATVGSQTKRELVKQLFGLSDDQIFNSRDETFAQDVLHATEGRGVDVVLNSLGGELLRQSWECIAPFGRFIDIGKADIIANNTLPMGPFNRNVTFSAVDLVVVHEEAKPLMKKILQDVTRLFEENPHLHEPKPLHVFSPSKLEDAMRFLQGGKNTGKVIIDYASATDTVEYRPSQLQHGYNFDANATYVISGGLGGLGREIARWMVSRGARNLLLLSSRGVAGRPDALKLIQELEATDGVTVLAPTCNVVDRGAVEDTLLKASRELPPIKGCIQAAMVLRDDMLAKMSHSMFHETLGPKRAGSWNLHQLLPDDMDFFVLLSSFCGIMGNRGQSNYAAGNAFEDALARHRVAQGLKGVSVDLVLVAEAGWANVNYESVTQSLRAGHDNLTQAQLMELLDLLCDPSYDCAKPGAAQVVNMVDSAADLARMTQQGLLDWMQKPMFSNLLRMGETEASGNGRGAGGGNGDGSDDVNRLALVKAAPDLSTASEIVTQGLVQKLAKSLSVPIETLDVGKPAYVVGVDSLIAVEVRYWFMKQLLVEVPVFEILKNQSITDLCQQVASKVLQSSSK